MAFVNEKEEEEDAEKAQKEEFIEEEPSGLVSGIKIKHLCKVSIWMGSVDCTGWPRVHILKMSADDVSSECRDL